MPRLVKLKNMKEFKRLQQRVIPPTVEGLDKRLTKLEDKVHSLEMMVIRTRASFLTNE